MATPAPHKPFKVACTECRQQKSKCDLHLKSEPPCSRCERVKAECVVSEDFKRAPKRKRVSELEQEIAFLRESQIKSTTLSTSLGSHIEESTTNGSSTLTPDNHVPPSGKVNMWVSTTYEKPKPRSLNGVEVTGEEIEDIFRLFFSQYTKFFNIVNPATQPDDLYEQSPLLFWAIIGVASRTYTKNPTLLTALSYDITKLALLSPVADSPLWHTLKALLLLLTWFLPRGSHRDTVFALNGVLLHVAMQTGLHAASFGHEFSNPIGKPFCEGDLARRATLWTYCVEVYQRTCVLKGQPLRTTIPQLRDMIRFCRRNMPPYKLSPVLLSKLECRDLVTRCSMAASDNGLQTMSLDQERSLQVLVENFESQVECLEIETPTDESVFDRLLTCLSIQAFYFYLNELPLSVDCLIRIVSTACDLIDCVQTILRPLESALVAPIEATFSLLLASSILLRVLKTSTFSHAFREKAKASFFLAIQLLKDVTLEGKQNFGSEATVLNQLWNSVRVFRKPDGSPQITLRARSRLVQGPIRDVFLWWDEEFGPKSTDVVTTVASDKTNHVETNDPTMTVDHSQLLDWNNLLFTDFQWDLSADTNVFGDPLRLDNPIQ